MWDWRSFLLRRLLGRFRIGSDIVRHLTTFQRLGETLEISAPSEMLPVGARTLLRAVRTRGGVQIRPDWVWPYWLTRQLDPCSPSFIPRGHLPVATNVTHRNWTMVGNAGSPWEAIVDPAGLVTAWFDGWSLDWWVHDGERWRYPSREPNVSQSLVGSAPVVETWLQMSSGRAVERVYATADAGGELVAVELENETGRPLEVALAIRPYNPEGLAVVEAIRVEDGVVHADGRPALLLPGPPPRALLSTFAGGDVAHGIGSGAGASSAGGARPPGEVRDHAGLAQAAFVYELPPGGRLLVAVPLEAERRTSGRRVPERRARDARRVEVEALPRHEAVAEEWRRRLDRGMRVRLPDERLQRAVDANRAYLLLFHDGADITPGPFTYHRFWFRDAAYQLAALDRWGLHREAAEVLASYPSRQRLDGYFYSQWREWDANGAAIWAIAEHHRLTGDDELIRSLAPSVRKGAEWIGRKLKERRREAPGLAGLLPPSISAEHLGPFDYYYWDDFWALRGLLDATYVLELVGDQGGARASDIIAARLRDALERSLELAAVRIGRMVMPAGPARGVDAGVIGSLVAVWPLGLLPPHDPRVVATLEALDERFTIGDAFFQGIAHTGLGTYLTMQIAFVELAAGDRRAWRRLEWLLDAATPTFTWPEAIHPQLGTGCMGDGHHGWAAADFLSFVRNVLVREAADGSVALLTLLPPGWEGREVEVEAAPTHRGTVSYRVRWKGERPEIEWEREGRAVPIRAPGLDPEWVSEEQAGRALLAPRASAGTPLAAGPSGGTAASS